MPYTMSPAQYATKCEIDNQTQEQLNKNKKLARCLARNVAKDVAEEVATAVGVTAAGQLFGPEVGLPTALIVTTLKSRTYYKAIKGGMDANDFISCVMDAYGD